MSDEQRPLTDYGITFYVPLVEGEDEDSLQERAKRLGTERIEHLAEAVFSNGFRDWVIAVCLNIPHEVHGGMVIPATATPWDRQRFFEEYAEDVQGLQGHSVGVISGHENGYWLFVLSEISGISRYGSWYMDLLSRSQGTVGGENDDDDDPAEAWKKGPPPE